MLNLIPYKIILFVIVATGFCEPSLSQKKYLSQEQMLKYKMPVIVVPLPQFIRWDDDAHLIFDRRFFPDTALKTITVDATTGMEIISAKDYKVQPNRTKRVYLKNDDLYFSNNNIETRLTNNKEVEKNPTLSPDSSEAAYTRNNNLYVFNLITMKETQLTFDGSDSIMNGYASWVYNEEILNSSCTFWW